jgi:hypothetical protein
VLTVVSCTVDPSTPAPTPAAAVAILTTSLGPSRVPAPTPSFEPAWWVNPPVAQTYDRDWPFTGSFAPTWVPTDRWLDGTPRVDPLAYGGYGGSPWLFGPTGGRLGFGELPRGRGRPDGRVNRPAERTPLTPTRVQAAPAPSDRAPLAAPSGSVRPRVRKD